MSHSLRAIAGGREEAAQRRPAGSTPDRSAAAEILLREVSQLQAQAGRVAAAVEAADQPGFAPTALFSALAPRTRIPPHTGSTNSRLVVHLPLVLPGPARFRVGNDTRAWRMGEAWVFDDTIEHEAWNDADETRVILIFDIWNPLLSQAERELISAMMTAHTTWHTQSR